MADFIPGIELAGAFYEELIRPVVAERFGLRHAAALIGPGSEVLGFDTPLSTDHHWGPRIMLFLTEDDHRRYADELSESIHRSLPRRFRGYATFYVRPPDEPHTLMPAPDDADESAVRHRADIFTVREFFKRTLGFDTAGGVGLVDWLVTPQQILRSVTAGRVYADTLPPDESLTALRDKLAYYPHDVWLYLLAAQWTCIAQEESFVGRTGDVGDEIGSRVMAARLVRDAMLLCFLMAREYAPYPKWFGTAFSRLPSAPALTPLFERALAAGEWRDREAALCEAWSLLARFHNALAITEPLAEDVSAFYTRPYRVLRADRFAEAITGRITDPAVLALPRGVGGIDQFADSTDVLSEVARFREMACFYLAGGASVTTDSTSVSPQATG